MYDVTLPGLVNMPYAYIKSLRVDFKGTVRNKSFYINGLGNITAPIPDAYEVTIELQSLILDYANLMVGEGFGVRIIDNEVSVGRNDNTGGPKPGDGDTVATFTGGNVDLNPAGDIPFGGSNDTAGLPGNRGGGNIDLGTVGRPLDDQPLSSDQSRITTQAVDSGAGTSAGAGISPEDRDISPAAQDVIDNLIFLEPET